jgi:hypothetical protein
MRALILTIAGWFGISPLRLIIYAVAVVAVVTGALVVRQHYVNLGYAKAIAAVKKQDDRAVAAADKVQQRADDCAANSWWDVILQSCKLEQAK